MKDEDKSREQLLIELRDARSRIADLQKSENKRNSIKPDIIGTAGSDQSDYHRVVQALRDCEETFRAFAENSLDVIMRFDRCHRHLYVNPVVERQTGISWHDFIGKTHRELGFPEDLVKIWEDALSQVFTTAKPHRVEFILPSGDWIDWLLMPELRESGEVHAVMTSARDITRMKQAEMKLRDSQERLAQIIEFLPDATLVIDADGCVTAWNRAMADMTGIPAEMMLGKGNFEYAIPFYGVRRPILIDLALRANETFEAQYTSIRRQGDMLFGEAYTPALIGKPEAHLSATASVLRDANGAVIGAIECIRDVTDRKKTEDERQRLAERLHRAEKMEALGLMAGGVAHDLNNILGVLVGYSELLLLGMEEENPQRRHVENILKSGQRGAAVIQDLLTLARRNVNISEVVNLNSVVKEYLKTPEFEALKAAHPAVVYEVMLNDNLLNLKGSTLHLEKTVMNLMANAAEAISGGGVVTISTENRYLDRPINGYDRMQEGDYVVLSVTDSGSGITKDDLGRIFEPFYTKKIMGRSGTGLGLAVVWGTVKDHNGYIDVKSEVGRGSIFNLYFPVTRDEANADRKKVPSIQYSGHGELILVVDDVGEQRDLAQKMLTRIGYCVTTVASGEEACEYLKNNRADLLVLDMIMGPGMDGLDTYRKIIEINPGQKAIIVSGFSESDRVRKALALGAGAYVPKPYVMEQIGMAIWRELERPGTEE
ncbi:MAG: PAS domain S-box protein [Syntrophaceae bacterium]|nr:PAS domain S-box protein [Syntrophaceae bacterium]